MGPAALTPDPAPNNGRGEPRRVMNTTSSIGWLQPGQKLEVTVALGSPLPLLGEGSGVRALRPGLRPVVFIPTRLHERHQAAGDKRVAAEQYRQRRRECGRRQVAQHRVLDQRGAPQVRVEAVL